MTAQACWLKRIATRRWLPICLKTTLASSAKTEEAPAFVAHDRLAQLDERLGNATAASRERAAAVALAHEYKPAEEARP